MAKWLKIGDAGAPAPGAAKSFEADGCDIAVFNVEGSIHAIGNTCPHRGGPLAEGSMEGAIVTCPWHGWRFDVSTGCHPEAPELRVRRYAVESRDDGLYIDLEHPGDSGRPQPGPPDA